jgi:glycosyltransferase involved in cell wall biosynthesis
MAAGLPVVASGIPGYADVLADGCGVTVPPADPQALADALTRVLGDEELRDRLVKRGLRATRRLAWDRVATEIAGVYERALARFALRQRRRRPRAVRPAAAR